LKSHSGFFWFNNLLLYRLLNKWRRVYGTFRLAVNVVVKIAFLINNTQSKLSEYFLGFWGFGEQYVTVWCTSFSYVLLPKTPKPLLGSLKYLMKFQICGGLDCPEWVLSEVAVMNKVSTVKLRLILGLIVKKITGQAFEEEKLRKQCKDSKLSTEDTNCFLALLEFLLTSSAKYDVSDQVLSKELLQMGVAIENANGLVKSYAENLSQIQDRLKNESLKVSQLDSLQYKLSYIFATSKSGHNVGAAGTEPLTTAVTLRIDLT